MMLTGRIAVVLGLLTIIRANAFVPARPIAARSISKPREPTSLRTADFTIEQDHQSSINRNDDAKKEKKEPPFVWTRQWYPLLPVDMLNATTLNEDIPKPKQLTVLGKNLVIWNNGEQWSVMEDVCPHRRAPLSTGKILNNTLMCRFHGWEFDASGACTKIPMQQSTNKPATRAKAKAFPCQVKGGLLWAFLDETVENPPELSPDAYVEGDGSHMQYIVTVFPVSYRSMVENSFDPAHAPFIHEGTSEFGGRVYSPEAAMPMERYEHQEGTKSTKEGFILEHTPYMQTPPDAPPQITTRQFIAPATQITKSMFFQAHLHFTPSTPRETLVIFSFPKRPANANGNKKKQAKELFTSLLPKERQDQLALLQQDFQHFDMVTSDAQTRFMAQDTLTMQGQDFNKQYPNKVVVDMAPVPADQGVSIFQKWVQKFAGGGPFFSDTAASDASFQPTLSPWDTHMKHCPTCKRSIQRLSKWSLWAKKLSRRGLKVCAALALLSFRIDSKLAMRLSYAGLLASVALRWVHTQWSRRVEDAFVSGASARHPKNHILFETYAK